MENGAWWTAVVQWRNWPLLVKLGVVLIVPVVGALVLGVLRVHEDVTLAGTYQRVEQVAALRVQLGHTLSAVQEERNEAARGGPDVTRLIGITDAAADRTRAALSRTPGLGENATRLHRAMTGTLGLLGYARERVAAGGDTTIIFNAYNTVAKAILEFDRALVGRFPDEQLASASIALNELHAMREQVGVQHAAGLFGLRDGRISDAEGQPIVEADIRLDDTLGDFLSVAPPSMAGRYERSVTGSAVAARQVMADAVRSGTAEFSQGTWDAALVTTAGLMRDAGEAEANRLRADSARLAEQVSNRAGAESVLLLALVLVAASVGGGLGRYLLRSFGTLRRTALDVAAHRLPAAVAAIRAGESDKTAIEPVPLHTTEEFGQLARAFDMVHDQAVRSAADEAELRRDLSNIFLNLSRRSQGLVERQLRQLEQLEQKADDPDQLANLFRIDHLATRMRRNNENLMVLSGAVLGRRFTEPVPLSDVLRAAVSEVEQYQRALVRNAPGTRIVGYAAGDLIRSAAELIENATTFSPPESQVVIESRPAEDGSLLIDILDEGVGMADTELHEANQRVAAGGGVEVPISRQMGLFVVGRLTARHGITVELRRREEQGLCASVVVPAALVSPLSEPTPEPTPEPEPAALAHPPEVSDRLELAGIHVRLPELPGARTPASILFTAQTPADTTTDATTDTMTDTMTEPGIEPVGAPPERSGFTWLRRPFPGRPGVTSAGSPPPAAPVTPAARTTAVNGLPKRVPRGQLLAPPAQPALPEGGRRARDAARARGFLSDFQSGIRNSQNRKGEI